ncbi:MAG: DUF2461 domain-containing protein [Alphaproteobacteria bacterium]|nr:DUF2461 domain-containing protein [Alphaproteobacteria bacterium]
MTTFPGFPADLQPFLADLAAHNDRAWFAAHRARYEQALLEPAKAFVTAMLEPLAAFDPPVHGAPQVNGSIFRIARDTRFSADKTPYKTNAAFHFWHGDDKKSGASFYLGIEPDGVHAGAGAFAIPKERIGRYRDAVAGPRGVALAEAVDALRAQGWTTGGEATVRVPRGFDPDHPRAELLKHKGFYVVRELDLGEALHGPQVVDHVIEGFRAAAPVARWLQEQVLAG